MIKSKELRKTIGDEELLKVTERLKKASVNRQMHLENDHPWDELVTDKTWLRRREALSIYGTPYYKLATEDELRRLSFHELGTWWQAFMLLEQILTEYYMRLINNGAFQDRPELIDYMLHFSREEITHSMVFFKAMNHFGIPLFDVPDFLKDFYVDNCEEGSSPLMSIYLTMLIEWVADEYQIFDVDGPEVSPLAKAVVKEHRREEARHIEWAKNMIYRLAQEDQSFLDQAQQYTPPFMRQLLDQGVTNVDCFRRVGFANKAFEDIDTLLETVLYNDYRKKIHQNMTKHIIRFLIESGIYDEKYHELWQAADLEEDIELAKKFLLKKKEKEAVKV